MATVLSIGYPIAIVQNTVYALPARQVHLFANDAVEISADNSNWKAATGANTVGIFVSAGWLRCTGGNTTVVLKAS